MAQPTYSRRHRERLGFNMTPMIDIVLLLIIFFMIVSRFASAEHATLDLPHPDHSKAETARLPEKVTINVAYSGEDSPPAVTLGPILLGPINDASLQDLSARLARERARSPGLQALLRVDRRVKYGFVRRVMKTIADNRIELMNMAARHDPK